jgi:transcription elongation factor GreA
MNDTLITETGLARLKDELHELRTSGRASIADRIRQAAAAEVNAVEGAEYQAARQDQILLERRIALLEDRIATATVAAPNGRNGLVDLGERVTVRDVDTGAVGDYVLVGTLESNPSAGRISAASPLGRALLGARRGDLVRVDAPRGVLQLEIVEIGSERSHVLELA